MTVRPERVIVFALLDWPGATSSGSSAAMDATVQVKPAESSASAKHLDFAPVFAQITELVPEIEELRPGVVAMRARGPARYYGSERAAAQKLLDFSSAKKLGPGRAGIADGKFAAEQATLIEPAPAGGIRVVEAGGSAAFLSDLPVAVATDDRLAGLLPGLGIYTLGAFAALPEGAVRARFGPAGVLAHRHSRGEDAERGEPIRAQRAERDFALATDFEPPIAGTEQLTFACSALAESFFGALTEERLVCTSLRITLTDDLGIRHERDWSHPRFFSPQDALARLRWQAESLVSVAADERTGAGIAAVRLFPARADRTASHEPGLWTNGPDERVHHHLSRAQGLLGPAGVGTMLLDGGRLMFERQTFTNWGSAPARSRASGPWPGALGAPHPSIVFDPPLRAKLRDHSGEAVLVDDEDLLASAPSALRVEGHQTPGAVRGWSKPWPIREHWWEGKPERFRVQIELDTGDSWLLLARTSEAVTTWHAEGRYD